MGGKIRQMLHRIYIGEDVNNVIAVQRRETTDERIIQYDCLCGLCGAKIIRNELALRLMTALPCSKCCKKYHITYIPTNAKTTEETINIE